MSTIQQLIKHLLPLSLGIGSIILKFNNISGWFWFLLASFLLASIIDDDKNGVTKNKEN